MSEENLVVVATHDGRHHADEVLACWFYSVLHGGAVRIVRTSDKELQRLADALLDAGGQYDPLRDRIDHHGDIKLPDPPPHRISGYATAGLVWRLYGRRICRLLLDKQEEGPWSEYRTGLPEDDLVECLDQLVRTLDQEIIAPIDAWDLGLYPEHFLSRHLLPFQWVLPHLEFTTAMEALGRAFSHRLRTLADNLAGESNLEHDLLNNGPSAFWALGDWLVVKAEDGRRVELRSAKRFASRTMGMPLLAVVSSLRGGSRWGAFLPSPLPYEIRIPSDLEFAGGRRSLFHDRPERLLDFLRECAADRALHPPVLAVDSAHVNQG